MLSIVVVVVVIFIFIFLQAGEVAQHYRALASLPEDLGFWISAPTLQLITVNNSIP